MIFTLNLLETFCKNNNTKHSFLAALLKICCNQKIEETMQSSNLKTSMTVTQKMTQGNIK